MKRRIVIGAFSLGAVVLASCSSENDILPKKERFTPTTPARDAASSIDSSTPEDDASDGKTPRDPQANCVPPGTPRNERDVGGYCETDEDCASDQGPRFCTGTLRDITVIRDDEWYCSTVCTVDDECGTGAVCFLGVPSRGCVPLACRKDGAP